MECVSHDPVCVHTWPWSNSWNTVLQLWGITERLSRHTPVVWKQNSQVQEWSAVKKGVEGLLTVFTVVVTIIVAWAEHPCET